MEAEDVKPLAMAEEDAALHSTNLLADVCVAISGPDCDLVSVHSRGYSVAVQDSTFVASRRSCSVPRVLRGEAPRLSSAVLSRTWNRLGAARQGTKNSVVKRTIVGEEVARKQQQPRRGGLEGRRDGRVQCSLS